MTKAQILKSLDSFNVELPSWGFADTGTRFGKFTQDASAIDTNDKLADAGFVHKLTGACPTVAMHVLWDFPNGVADAKDVVKMARKHGVKIGAINPNLFQDQCYKFGSFSNPDEDVRKHALQHSYDSIEIAKLTKSRDISFWFADGTNYPGQDSILARKARMSDCLKKTHRKLGPKQQMLVEYKPFEPAFYATDIADWGMAYILSKSAGNKAKVLVDTGHHYNAQNIEQIVAWLLDEDMLGGFHFNDRRYADDDLTLGSIDPYQVFRIFNEIHAFADTKGGKYPDIGYMIDQSHNLKPKLEAMVQTVIVAQEMWTKAALVDRKALAKAQAAGDVTGAERCLQEAFFTDVTDILEGWRKKNNLPLKPLAELKKSRRIQKIGKERAARRKALGMTSEGGYA